MANRHQNGPVRQNIGLRKSKKESTGPMRESTTPKDTDIQEDKLNGHQPEEGNKDTSTSGLLKPKQPPSQGIGDGIHTTGNPNQLTQGTATTSQSASQKSSGRHLVRIPRE